MFFFYRVEVAVFPDAANTKQLWYGTIPVMAGSIEEAREKALRGALDSPEVRVKVKHYPEAKARVYSMNRSRQIFR